MNLDNRGQFAAPRTVRFEDCEFYHTVEIPGHGVVHGQWDLRDRVDEYLGFYEFARKRILEIGPASGFLTFEMEKRGADVVALEVPDDPGWDFVPYPDERMASILDQRRQHMRRIKDSFWFLHDLNQSKARICYGDSCNIPDVLGSFDAAVMASVLLHCERPLRIIAECAKRVDTLIITDLYKDDLEGNAVCRLVPDAANFRWDTWWEFSTTFFEQFFSVLGFSHTVITRHNQTFAGHGPIPLFTIIGSKSASSHSRIRELQSRIAAQEAQIATQETQIATQEAQIARLEAVLKRSRLLELGRIVRRLTGQEVPY